MFQYDFLRISPRGLNTQPFPRDKDVETVDTRPVPCQNWWEKSIMLWSASEVFSGSEMENEEMRK